jgi:hypothetical protein
MSRHIRKWLIGVVVVAIVLAAAGGWVYTASRHVPEFYAEALKPMTSAHSQSGHELTQNVAAISSEALRGGRWRATFSDWQINSFLAVDIPKKHPRLLPANIHDPRVSIRREEASIGWRVSGGWEAVYSLSIVPYVAEPNVLSVRIRRIRAGALPVPLGEVVDGLSQAARQAGLRLQWQQTDGDPVAVIHLPTDPDAPQRLLLDTVELTDGAIVVAGHTEPQADTEQAALPRSAR